MVCASRPTLLPPVPQVCASKRGYCVWYLTLNRYSHWSYILRKYRFGYKWLWNHYTARLPWVTERSYSYSSFGLITYSLDSIGKLKLLFRRSLILADHFLIRTRACQEMALLLAQSHSVGQILLQSTRPPHKCTFSVAIYVWVNFHTSSRNDGVLLVLGCIDRDLELVGIAD